MAYITGIAPKGIVVVVGGTRARMTAGSRLREIMTPPSRAPYHLSCLTVD